MSVGVLILAHDKLHRVAQLANGLAEVGCRVGIHIDAKVKSAPFQTLQNNCADKPLIQILPRLQCEWGMFSLVDATLKGAEAILETWKEVQHVCLISGSCLPIRPVKELQAFLLANTGTDFIESVNVSNNRWVQGGLAEERFTLNFPFSWQRQRWLFDRYVDLQRRFGVRRAIPEGVFPHIGSQWWCLSRGTLSAILNDPRRPEFDAYFARTWIPDETYFQTLVRRHAIRIENKSLTFSSFDQQGKPYVFYEDHKGLLENSDCFFARKIWPGAGKLYRDYLDPDRLDVRGLTYKPKAMERPFRIARQIRCEGRPGLIMQSRFPCRGFERQPSTTGPYIVFEGFDHLSHGWHRWLRRQTDSPCHGRLFGPRPAELAGDKSVYKGNVSSRARIRDWDQPQYLCNLLRQDPDEVPSFQFCPTDSPRIDRFLRRDPNVRLFRIEECWLITIFIQSAGRIDEARKLMRKHKKEAKAYPAERHTPERADVESWSLRDALIDSSGVIEQAANLAFPGQLKSSPPLPDLLTGFGAFLERLGHPLAEELKSVELMQARVPANGPIGHDQAI